jgi:hypothetical protein
LAVIDELKEQLGHAPAVLRKFRSPRVRARFESRRNLEATAAAQDRG